MKGAKKNTPRKEHKETFTTSEGVVVTVIYDPTGEPLFPEKIKKVNEMLRNAKFMDSDKLK